VERLNGAFSTDVEHDVTEQIAALGDLVRLGNTFERQA
jgi:hypothetical protein